MNYQEVLAEARGVIGKYCKACPVCNGRACGNQIPGPGAKGSGDTAIRNFEKWQEIRVRRNRMRRIQVQKLMEKKKQARKPRTMGKKS